MAASPPARPPSFSYERSELEKLALLSLPHCDRCGFSGNRRYRTAVLRPARLGGFDADGAFLAVGNRIDPRRRNTERHQIFPRGCCAARTKRQIVFARAAFVAIALNLQCDIAITIEPRRLLLQH